MAVDRLPIIAYFGCHFLQIPQPSVYYSSTRLEHKPAIPSSIEFTPPPLHPELSIDQREIDCQVRIHIPPSTLLHTSQTPSSEKTITLAKLHFSLLSSINLFLQHISTTKTGITSKIGGVCLFKLQTNQGKPSLAQRISLLRTQKNGNQIQTHLGEGETNENLTCNTVNQYERD